MRSPISPDEATNIDIVFYAVEYLDIPSHLPGVEFVEPTSEEVSQIEKHHGRDFSDSTIFCLASGGRRFFVVALTYKVYENELELFDSILTYGIDERPREDFGRLLAGYRRAKVPQALA